MSSIISVWGKHQEYPVHVNIDGQSRFFPRFSVAFDVESGILYFEGLNKHGVTEKCLKVEI